MGYVYFPQFEKGKKGIRIHSGLTILEHARKSGIEINAECGGIGKCGKCVVRIEKGNENLNPPTDLEKNFSLKEDERLACQAKILNEKEDIVVYIKNFGEYEILKYGIERKIPLSPIFYRTGNRIFKNGEEIDEYKGKIYGLAIDIGTTTVVIEVVDLENGNIVEKVAKTNPQISYGNDVISRIEYVLVDKESGKYFEESERERKVKDLQKPLINMINRAIDEISGKIGDDISKYIYDAVVVGNPTMRNLFFGIDVSSLGIIPFEPVHKEPVIRKPEDIGLKINEKGQIYGACLVGGHIGADSLANILSSEIYKREEICMIVDIGTNGEIIIGNKEKIIATSAAAGGAFEGATVSCGIGAIEGAIKEIRIVDGKVVYSTIGNKPPKGICGSGLIDLLAEFLNHNIMTKTAKIKEDFYITDELKITQKDIYQLITSKAAIKTAQNILAKYYPVEIENIDKIFISGGFGNFINVKNAMRIGLIPEVDEKKVIKIGNGALEGAREMLLSGERRKLSEEIAKKVKHVKINEIEKNFEYIMAENMYFE